MFCKKCGTEYRPGAKFCAKCGNPAPVPAPMPEKVTPDREIKTVLKRGEETAPISAPRTETTPAEPPKLIITMDETKASSNGQFDEWFSEPGDLE